MDNVGTTGVGVGVGIGIGVDVGVGSGVGDGEGVGVGVATGEGFLTTTPLFQTSFVPDLMQVNFFPPETEVAPAFVHLAPALTAANDGAVARDSVSKRATTIRERVI
jgi:hypothetical protein